jgi:hypothetical protein
VALVERVDADGVYLAPPHVLGLDLPSPHEPNTSTPSLVRIQRDATRIARTITVDNRRVRVTHGGGVFVERRSVIGRDGYDLQSMLADQDDAVRIINLVVCELDVNAAGICSAVTRADLCTALVEGRRASIWAAAGSSQFRSWATQKALLDADPNVLAWPRITRDTLAAIVRLRRSAVLSGIADTLPELISAGVYYTHQGRPAEGIINCFVAIEQMINQLWRTTVIPTATDAKHRDSLSDTRTWTTAARSELLMREGTLPEPVFEAVRKARKHRNDVAHEGTASVEGNLEALEALQLVLALALVRAGIRD